MLAAARTVGRDGGLRVGKSSVRCAGVVNGAGGNGMDRPRVMSLNDLKGEEDEHNYYAGGEKS